VVANIKSSKHINDLVSISVPPFEAEDAEKFATHLCKSNGIEIEKSDVLYMLEKIEWYIPFYIQLIVQEVKRLYRRNPTVSRAVIDQAIEKVLQHKKDFVHWEERLSSFSKEGKRYAKEVLNVISEHKTLESNKLVNMGAKYELEEDDAKQIIHSLKYDGYINNSDDAKIYRFNSPMLRTWWYQNVAN